MPVLTQLQLFTEPGPPAEQEYLAMRKMTVWYHGWNAVAEVRWCTLNYAPGCLVWGSQVAALALPERLWRHYDTAMEILELHPVTGDFNAVRQEKGDIRPCLTGGPVITPWPLTDKGKAQLLAKERRKWKRMYGDPGWG